MTLCLFPCILLHLTGFSNNIVFWLLYQFQTTAPKSCYMRPPGGILAPGESMIATGNVFSIFF